MEVTSNITGDMPITTGSSLHIGFKYAFSAVAVFGICINVAALAVLLQCKRIPKTVQLACSNILMFEIVPLIGHPIFELADNFPMIQLQIFRYDKLFIFMTWTMTTLMSLERVFVVESPRLYMRYVTQRHIRICCGSLWLLLGIGVVILSAKRFEVAHMKGLCWFGIAINLCYSVIITACCTRLGILCRRHIMQIQINIIPAREVSTRDRKHKYTSYTIIGSTKMLVIFVGLFLSMNIPFVVEKTSEDCRMIPQRSFCFYLVILNNSLNPFIYVLRFKECKLICLELLYRCFPYKRLNNKISELKSNIFEIPTLQKTIGDEACFSTSIPKRNCSTTV